MAYSKNTYPGTGAQTDFTVDFPYLDADHVGVTVDGASKSFTWVNASTIRISPAPAAGKAVVISRSTSRATRIASYTDLQMLNMAAMNADARQLFYVAQEAFDAAAESPSGGDMRGSNNLSEVNPSAARSNIGALASASPVITGNLTLDDVPTDPLHAVTKAYVDAAIAAIPGGSGEVNTASSVGGGVPVLKGKSGLDFEFYTLEAGAGATITPSGNKIIIGATGAGGGEVNTMASTGVTGLSVYKDKVGVMLRTKGVGAFNASLSTADSTVNDILLKVNEAHGMAWTAEQRFTGGTAVPAISSAQHGIDVAGGALANISTRVTRTAPNTAGTPQVQAAAVTHVVTGTATTAWEWAHLILLDNYCTTPGTDQVGLYVKSHRRAGALAHHWGACIEVENQSSNKSASLFGLEISTCSDGTETAGNSGPLSLFYGARSVSGDVASLMDHGLLIAPMLDYTNSRLTYGIRIQGRPDYAIAQGAPGNPGHSTVSMIAANGRYSGPALDTAGNQGAACALRARSGQAIRMSGTDAAERDMVWNAASDRMEFQWDGNVQFHVPLKTPSGEDKRDHALGLYSMGASAIITASAGAGFATAATPAGYIRIKIDGNAYRLAFYND